MISRFTDSLATGAGTFLYQAIDGKFSKAFVVPALGCYLIYMGNYCNTSHVSASSIAPCSILGGHCQSNAVNELGLGLILSAILAIPGSIVGYALNTIERNSPRAKVIAYMAGSWVTLEAYKKNRRIEHERNTITPLILFK